jgi:hypothetical protein
VGTPYGYTFFIVSHSERSNGRIWLGRRVVRVCLSIGLLLLGPGPRASWLSTGDWGCPKPNGQVRGRTQVRIECSPGAMQSSGQYPSKPDEKHHGLPPWPTRLIGSCFHEPCVWLESGSLHARATNPTQAGSRTILEGRTSFLASRWLAYAPVENGVHRSQLESCCSSVVAASTQIKRAAHRQRLGSPGPEHGHAKLAVQFAVKDVGDQARAPHPYSRRGMVTLRSNRVMSWSTRRYRSITMLTCADGMPWLCDLSMVYAIGNETELSPRTWTSCMKKYRNSSR